jgi:hypothetical protein
VHCICDAVWLNYQERTSHGVNATILDWYVERNRFNLTLFRPLAVTLALAPNDEESENYRAFGREQRDAQVARPWSHSRRHPPSELIC